MTGFYGLDIPEFYKIYRTPVKCGRKAYKTQWLEMKHFHKVEINLL